MKVQQLIDILNTRNPQAFIYVSEKWGRGERQCEVSEEFTDSRGDNCIEISASL